MISTRRLLISQLQLLKLALRWHPWKHSERGNEETVLQLRTVLSNLEDLDYSEAVTQMQKICLAPAGNSK